MTGPEDEPNPSVNSDIDSMAGEDDERGFDDMPVEYWADCDFEPEDEDEDYHEVYNDDEDEMTDTLTYLTEEEFADRYRLGRRTVQRWRQTGDGPAWFRLGPRRLVYRLADIEAWVASRASQPEEK